jgi:hypothetical protein
VAAAETSSEPTQPSRLEKKTNTAPEEYPAGERSSGEGFVLGDRAAPSQPTSLTAC